MNEKKDAANKDSGSKKGKNGFFQNPQNVILLVVILIMFGIIIVLLMDKDTEERTEKAETEQVQPETNEKELEASREMRENIRDLGGEKVVADPQPQPKTKSAPKQSKSVSRPKTNSNPYNVGNYTSWLREAQAVPASSVTFTMKGNPDLSNLDGDMGTILVPLAVNSENYVAVMYLKRKAIAKMAKHVQDLNPNVVPMTNKPGASGQKWTIDASGEVFFYRDEGQQFSPNSNAKSPVKLDCYLGERQVKDNGQIKTYDIWLGWEVATLNNTGVLNLSPSANILHRPSDGGKVLVNVYEGVNRVN